MAITNFMSGVHFEHKTQISEVRSLVRTISPNLHCIHYYGNILVTCKDQVILDIGKDYVTLVTTDYRHYVNLLLGGLGTGIELTRDNFIKRG